ncbi:MAG: hypothetical protein JNK04_01095 [Myxococcales bacterium]|nr:hypothetical protein [Myxococcales bacterium]
MAQLAKCAVEKMTITHLTPDSRTIAGVSLGRQVTWSEREKAREDYESARDKLILSTIALVAVGAAILYQRREARRRRKRAAAGTTSAGLLRAGAAACGAIGLGAAGYTALRWWRDQSFSIQLLFLGVISFTLASYLGTAAPRRERAVVRADEARARDPRPPVLYLRSFEAEDQPAADLGAFGELTDATSVEDAMLPKLGRLGPLVALENLVQPTVPATYSRETVDPKQWRKTVRRRATEARTIIVLLSSSAGLRWELAMLVRRNVLAKTVLVFPPGGAAERGALWQTFVAAAATVDPKWADVPLPPTEEELLEPAAVAVVFDASSAPSLLTEIGTVGGYADLAEAIAAQVERA